MDKTERFSIERAGLLKRRFRVRLYGANGELVWTTQTYADIRDAQYAIDFILRLSGPIVVDDLT